MIQPLSTPKSEDFGTNKTSRELTPSHKARPRLAEGKYAKAENKTEPDHTHGAAFNRTLNRTPVWLNRSSQSMWHVGRSSAGPETDSSASLLLSTCPSAQLESLLCLRISLSKYPTGILLLCVFLRCRCLLPSLFTSPRPTVTVAGYWVTRIVV